MSAGQKTKTLRIGGMTCAHCQSKIEKALRGTAGIRSARVSYGAGTAVVTYDADIIAPHGIAAVITKLGYRVLSGAERGAGAARTAGILLVVLALYMMLRQLGLTGWLSAFPTAQAGMGYGMLFVIGLMTSVHCLAMCGGLNLSQCLPQTSQTSQSSQSSQPPQPSQTPDAGRRAVLRPSLLYNLGRVLSYTAVGAVVGALGAAVSLSGAAKGAIQLLAGAFMILTGLTMLGLFPRLRGLVPRMPRLFTRRVDSVGSRRGLGPLYVGLLNGLMPCGPLQAMQLYALSTGGPARGALAMLVFSLGTVPLMFGLGALSTVLSRTFTKKAMTVGAVLVVVLGLSTFTNGWTLSGFLPAGAPAATQRTEIPRISLSTEGNTSAEALTEASPAEDAPGVQRVSTTLKPGRYDPITVRVDVPVEWTVEAPPGSITGCNNLMYIPEYGIEVPFQPGANLIEFTPTEAGTFPYFCWMGMIRSTITVEES
ncbi:MAG: sulfite exporter TauE/SafE family protein [Oscillospiraceae bacterium]|nr:sulfite exporter TauE/SafE family protein [Oscillospiraceae bacterium]